MHLAAISLASAAWDPVRSEPAMHSVQIAVNYSTARAAQPQGQEGRSRKDKELDCAKPGTEAQSHTQSQRSILVSVWSTERPQGDLLLATY